jgi:methionyl aminopeptidase
VIQSVLDPARAATHRPLAMIEIHGPADITRLRHAGAAAAATLAFVGERLRAGVTTAEIDAWVRAHTAAQGGEAA